jgi:leucyl aminopeptidase
MSETLFHYDATYEMQDNDLLVFPYRGEELPLFNGESCPAVITDTLLVSDDQGGRRCCFAGILNGNRIAAETVRLDARDVSPEQQMKSAVSSAITRAEKEFAGARVVVFLSEAGRELFTAVQEGAILGGYRFDRYLEKKSKNIKVFLVTSSEEPEMTKSLASHNNTVFEQVNSARDILNEPPNVIHPESLAEYFSVHGGRAGLDMEIWDETRLRDERCGGIIAVGQGAESRPRLVVGRWRSGKAKRRIALVGKGVTCDTGGYCLKPGPSQVGMKYDMGGAAMMFASACAAALLGLPLDITLFAPLVENDISGNAFHATDIITMRSGKTVQVDNTDAEGRLILADALALASEEKPDIIIDAATLTGACVVALGEDIAGLFSRDKELGENLLKAGLDTGEWLWPMPLHMPYMEQLKTEIADCRNLGDKWGGAVTAALFLGQFVPEEIPWAHIDIAGPSVKEEPLGHLGKGAKGFGVKTMVRFMSGLAD